MAAEQQLTSLESFIQDSLQVVTIMNANVAQQLLNHLQDEIIEDDQHQQPAIPLHPQSHSLEAHGDSVSCVCTYIRKLDLLNSHFYFH